MRPAVAVHLVRHAEVENPADIFYGRLPGFPLSNRGHRQAVAAARHLAQRPIAAIYSSPQLRARQTAEPLARRLGVMCETNDLLEEVRTAFEGCPLTEVKNRGFDIYSGLGESGESPEEVLLRGRGFLELALNRHSGQEVVGVTHGDIICFLLLWSQRRKFEPAERAKLAKAYPGHASVTTFTVFASNEAELPLWTGPTPPADW